MKKIQNHKSSAHQEPTSGVGGVSRSYRKAMPYINGFYVLAAAVALMGWLGWIADAYLNTKPVFFLIGLFVGMFIGFYNMFKLLKKLDKDT
jgi:F0F1-type ATP synthase assembly protein I